MSISLDVVIPCLNEERALPVCVRRLHEFMSEAMAGYDWAIVVADNGSTDGTLDAAESQLGAARKAVTKLEAQEDANRQRIRDIERELDARRAAMAAALDHLRKAATLEQQPSPWSSRANRPIVHSACIVAPFDQCVTAPRHDPDVAESLVVYTGCGAAATRPTRPAQKSGSRRRRW